MSISVCLASYGDESWRELKARATLSVVGQPVYEIIHVHQPEGDIASARNACARDADGDYLCFLDADDELDENFVHHIRRAIDEADPGPKMFVPRVSYVYKGKPQAPKYWPEKPLSQANWLIIGTVIPRDLFLEVGGFESWPHAYEDWQLFAKMWKAGAEIVKVPEAIYRAHVMPNSRNKRITRKEQVHWHYEIGKRLFPDEYPPDWPDRHLRNANRVTRRSRRA